MLRSRKLRIAVTAVASFGTVMGLAAIPVAVAADCTVTVKTITGQVVQLQLPPGAALPAGATLISSVCPPPVTTPTVTVPTTSTPSTTTTTTGSQTTTTGGSGGSGNKSQTTTSTTPTTTAPKPSSPGKSQQPSNHPAPAGTVGSSGSGKSSGKNKKKKKPAKSSNPPPQRTSGGVPTPSNPSFSFALPGAAPIGVPNFFIDSFRIPPFLLPIYQAAGIQYNVPWQILAAINEIETDYGRNLSVSTAGAVGWMQFIPSTWKRYGVDANGDGVADPYNPVDAIFAAARYLHAAGASKSLANAIFSYNHAGWYVQSVMLRAKLIGGMPNNLLGALTGLVEGHFPVAAPSRYADDAVEKLAKQRVKKGNAAVPINSDPNAKGVAVFAKTNSPVIAVNDGKVVKIGENKQLGRYLMLQDATGNVYTYAHLGSIPSKYPVPKRVKVTAKQITKQLSAPITPPPTGPASAGSQQAPAIPSASKATTEIKSSSSKAGAPLSVPVTPASAGSQQSSKSQPASSKSTGSQSTSSQSTDQAATIAAPLAKERLFANPHRPNSYAAGGAAQIKNTALQISNFRDYFSDVLHLGKKQYTLQPLKAGAVVVAGTILGRIGKGSATNAAHLEFMVRPAGKNAPQIDPKPILDGWKLLEATAVYRAAGVDPFFGPGAKNPGIGEILLMSKEQLQSRVLADPHVQIYACGRRDIQAGLIDRRILGVMEFLSASGLYPTVSGLDCGHSLKATTGVDAAGATGSSIDISKINNIPMQGHQGAGSITDIAIRRLLTLQGSMKPDEIVSTMSYKGQSNTLSLPDHGNRIQIEFTPLFGGNKKLSDEVKSILRPGQWIKLINHISQIPEPVIPIAPSKYAIKTPGSGQ